MECETKEDYIKKMKRITKLFQGKKCKPQKSKYKKIYKSRNIVIPVIPEHSAIRPKTEYKSQESRLRNRKKTDERE